MNPTTSNITPTASSPQITLPMMYPLGIIAATIDSFSGKDVARYLEKLEQRASLDGWSEDQTVKLLKCKLVGDAYNFFKSDPTLDTLSYVDFKNRLIQKFLPLKLPGENQLILSRCYQRYDENVSEYCTRLRALGAKLLEEDIEGAEANEIAGLKKKNKEIVLNQFKIGLRKDLMKEVGILLLREPNLDLDKAEQIVKLQETTLLMLQGRGNSSKVSVVSQERKCYACGKLGHLANVCRNRKDEEPNRNGRCYSCGKLGHFARECRKDKREMVHYYEEEQDTKKNGVCYTCGREGHIARECVNEKKKIVCYICQKNGHITKTCPERARNFQGRDETKNALN